MSSSVSILIYFLTLSLYLLLISTILCLSLSLCVSLYAYLFLCKSIFLSLHICYSNIQKNTDHFRFERKFFTDATADESLQSYRQSSLYYLEHNMESSEVVTDKALLATNYGIRGHPWIICNHFHLPPLNCSYYLTPPTRDHILTISVPAIKIHTKKNLPKFRLYLLWQVREKGWRMWISSSLNNSFSRIISVCRLSV